MVRNAVVKDGRKVEDDGSRNVAAQVHVAPYEGIARELLRGEEVLHLGHGVLELQLGVVVLAAVVVAPSSEFGFGFVLRFVLVLACVLAPLAAGGGGVGVVGFAEVDVYIELLP
mmetsp:Transcript_24438/g.36203  ORF Transcript_24438/g.36203 Transcript_24438/m.36203 type:complete len:114 (-) Transcript_24438:418-759(-)